MFYKVTIESGESYIVWADSSMEAGEVVHAFDSSMITDVSICDPDTDDDEGFWI